MAPKGGIACDLAVFSVGERGEHLETVAAWHDAIVAQVELEDGYRFELEPRDGLVATLGRFVEKERLCCPFFDFRLEIAASGPILLSITGPAGTKEILTG